MHTNALCSCHFYPFVFLEVFLLHVKYLLYILITCSCARAHARTHEPTETHAISPLFPLVYTGSTSSLSSFYVFACLSLSPSLSNRLLTVCAHANKLTYLNICILISLYLVPVPPKLPFRSTTLFSSAPLPLSLPYCLSQTQRDC